MPEKLHFEPYVSFFNLNDPKPNSNEKINLESLLFIFFIQEKCFTNSIDFFSDFQKYYENLLTPYPGFDDKIFVIIFLIILYFFIGHKLPPRRNSKSTVFIRNCKKIMGRSKFISRKHARS